MSEIKAHSEATEKMDVQKTFEGLFSILSRRNMTLALLKKREII
jgi:hypothetical protein